MKPCLTMAFFSRLYITLHINFRLGALCFKGGRHALAVKEDEEKKKKENEISDRKDTTAVIPVVSPANRSPLVTFFIFYFIF